MISFNLRLDTDEFLRVYGPVRTIDGTAIVSGVTGSLARLYDRDKDTVAAARATALTDGEPSAETAIVVDSIRGIDDGDAVEIDLDDGDVHRTIVNGAPSGFTVTLTVALPSAAAAGNALRVVVQTVGATLLYVASSANWLVGDDAQIHHITDDSYHAGIVVQTAANEIEIDTATIAALVPGDEVSRKLGGDITMETAFGTPETPPVPQSTAWGIQGDKSADHADLRVGQSVRVEYILDAGAGLRLHESARATIIGNE